MGWINNAKVAGAAEDARKAYAEGRSILTFKIIEANGGSRLTGVMPGVGEQIEAIEAEGWTLDTMTAAEGKTLSGERTALICLFRRRG